MDTSRITRLSKTNYSAWKISMSTLLRFKGLYETVSERSKIFDDEDDELPDDKLEAAGVKTGTKASILKANEEAKLLIYSTLSDHEILNVGECSSAYTLWLKLQTNHQGLEKHAKNTALSKLTKMTCHSDQTFVDFAGEFESLIIEYETCGGSMCEDTKLHFLKLALSDVLRQSLDLYELAEKSPTLEGALSYLKGRCLNSSSNQQSVALVSNNLKRDRQVDVCTFCKKKGHLWQKCRKRLERRENRPAKPESSRPNVLLISERTALASVKEPETIWIFDSGATDHMSHDVNLFRNLRRGQQKPIRLGDGQLIDVKGVGEVTLNGCTLTNVLFAPDIKYNLISIRRVNEKKCMTKFERESVSIFKDTTLVLKGEKLPGGLYGVRMDAEPSALVGATLQTWHKRFAHVNLQQLKKIISSGATKGLDLSKTDPEKCEPCAMAKICRAQHPPKTPRQVAEDELVAHVDLAGPISPTSLGGNNFVLVCVLEPSNYKLVTLVQNKSEVADKVINMVKLVERKTGKKVVELHSDHGSEFDNLATKRFLAENDIEYTNSTPYVPEQNGRAERAVRTLAESARTLLAGSKLPEELWGEAVKTAAYTSNFWLCPNKGITCYEALFNSKPRVDHLHFFGELAIIKINWARTPKFAPKGERVVFVGYTDKHNPFMFYWPNRRRVVEACDVLFQNTTASDFDQKLADSNNEASVFFYGPGSSGPSDINANSSGPSDINANSPGPSDINSSPPAEPAPDPMSQQTVEQHSQSQQPLVSNQDVNGTAAVPSTQTNDKLKRRQLTNFDAVETNCPRVGLSGPSNTMKIVCDPHNNPTSVGYFIPLDGGNEDEQNQSLDDFEQNFLNLSRVDNSTLSDIDENPDGYFGDGYSRFCMAAVAVNDDPASLKEAQQSQEWPQWQSAMESELKSLEANDTFEVVTRPKVGHPIRSKWVFKKKFGNDDSPKFKARLVACGYSQIHGVNYDETYAPVANFVSVRLLLALATKFDLKLAQTDIASAFLHGTLEEVVHMTPPAGVQMQPNTCWRLKKSLYGLKQAPRVWHHAFDSCLKRFELSQTRFDPCLYFNAKRKLFLLCYVDDALIACNDEQLILSLSQHISEEFDTRTLDAKLFLGLEIRRDNEQTFVSQSKYISSILHRFGMNKCNPTTTPAAGSIVEGDNTPLDDLKTFKSIVGSLIYLSMSTRPDISFAVGLVARTDKPTQAHLVGAKRILRYIAATPHHGLLFQKNAEPILQGYSDSDYATCPVTRKCITGILISFMGTPIFWKSQRQKLVTLSVTEAEFIAGCELAKALYPIRQTLCELDMCRVAPTDVFIDNSSTIAIAIDEKKQQRTKHIDVRRAWLAQEQELRKINIKKIASNDQKADILTKSLEKTKFSTARALIMVLSLTTLALLTEAKPTLLTNPGAWVSPVAFHRTNLQIVLNADYYQHTAQILNPCKPLGFNSSLESLQDCEMTFNQAVDKLSVCRDGHANATVKQTNKYTYFVPIRRNQSTDDWLAVNETVINKIANKLRANSDLTSRAQLGLHTLHKSHAKLSQVLHEINQAAADQKAHASFLLLDQTAQELNEANSTKLIKCNLTKSREGYELEYNFQVTQLATDSHVYKAAPVTIVNNTENGFCILEYSGPKLILFNETSNCRTIIPEHHLIQDIAQYVMCLTPDQELTPNPPYFEVANCTSDFIPDPRLVQVTDNGVDAIIFCRGYSIEIVGITFRCPSYAFKLPRKTFFQILSPGFAQPSYSDDVFAGDNYEHTQRINQMLQIPENSKIVCDSEDSQALEGTQPQESEGWTVRKLWKSATRFSLIGDPLEYIEGLYENVTSIAVKITYAVVIFLSVIIFITCWPLIHVLVVALVKLVWLSKRLVKALIETLKDNHQLVNWLLSRLSNLRMIANKATKVAVKTNEKANRAVSNLIRSHRDLRLAKKHGRLLA